MTRETVELLRLGCDGCGKAVHLEQHDMVPVGWFEGHVLWHHGGGGDGGSWSACSVKCIRKAVLTAAEGRTDEERR